MRKSKEVLAFKHMALEVHETCVLKGSALHKDFTSCLVDGLLGGSGDLTSRLEYVRTGVSPDHPAHTSADSRLTKSRALQKKSPCN